MESDAPGSGRKGKTPPKWIGLSRSKDFVTVTPAGAGFVGYRYREDIAFIDHSGKTRWNIDPGREKLRPAELPMHVQRCPANYHLDTTHPTWPFVAGPHVDGLAVDP